MRHTFLVTVKKWLKSVYTYGSYHKIKTGVPPFLEHSVGEVLQMLLDDNCLVFVLHVQQRISTEAEQ